MIPTKHWLVPAALALGAVACGTPATTPSIPPARIETPAPVSTPMAAPLPPPAPCVAPTNAPLSSAVDALVGGGHLTAAVHDTLAALRKDPRDLGAIRLRLAEIKRSDGLATEQRTAIPQALRAQLADATPRDPKATIAPIAADDALLRAAFGASAPTVVVERAPRQEPPDADSFASLEEQQLKHPSLRWLGVPRELDDAHVVDVFVHADHTVSTYRRRVDLAAIVVTAEGKRPRALGFSDLRDKDVVTAQLAGHVLLVHYRWNGYARPSRNDNFLAAYDADSGRVLWTSPAWPRADKLTLGFGAQGADTTPAPPAMEDWDIAAARATPEERCWAKVAVAALSRRDGPALSEALSKLKSSAPPIVELVSELAPASAELMARATAKELDLPGAPLIPVKSSPARAMAATPIGDAPKVARTLKETSRIKIDDPTKAPRDTFDARYPFEVREKELPMGARPDIPMTYGARPLNLISQLGDKTLLIYGDRFLAVVEGLNVAYVLDTNPDGLLKGDDQFFQDLHQGQVEDGVVYICHGYNSNLARKGVVSAVDARTGEVRWRSANLVCGGVLALVGDYVITGYGAWDMPYALKLLRKHDGRTVQSITHFGAALDFVVSGEVVTVRTFVDQMTYALSPPSRP